MSAVHILLWQRVIWSKMTAMPRPGSLPGPGGKMLIDHLALSEACGFGLVAVTQWVTEPWALPVPWKVLDGWSDCS